MRKPIPFGKYLLLERVNVGGMAEVFLAKAFGVEGFERLLAIKRILPTMVEDDEFITMFLDEARISVQLNHANIVQIHELGKHDESYYIAMEYVSGKDLRHLLERYRKRRELMPTAQAVFIASKICEGLDYAHRKKDARGMDLNIIHRDVSPQNILISYDGEVKIIDFGIAKAANRAQKTQAGILKGKFGYMSPEQVRGMPIDHRSDIFAVGVILYEMLTGERLFVGESDFSTLEKVRNADVLPPRQYNSAIPVGLEKVVLKALAGDPDDRYQWCSDLQEDLLRYLLSGDSVYTGKHLGSYMKESFAEDQAREQERLERFAEVERPEQVEVSGITSSNKIAPRLSSSIEVNSVLASSEPKRAPEPPVAPPPPPRVASPASNPATADTVGPFIPPPSDEELEEASSDRTEIFRPSFNERPRAPEEATDRGSSHPNEHLEPPVAPAAEEDEPESEGEGETVLGLPAFHYDDEPEPAGKPSEEEAAEAEEETSDDVAGEAETILGMDAPPIPGEPQPEPPPEPEPEPEPAPEPEPEPVWRRPPTYSRLPAARHPTSDRVPEPTRAAPIRTPAPGRRPTRPAVSTHLRPPIPEESLDGSPLEDDSLDGSPTLPPDEQGFAEEDPYSEEALGDDGEPVPTQVTTNVRPAKKRNPPTGAAPRKRSKLPLILAGGGFGILALLVAAAVLLTPAPAQMYVATNVESAAVTVDGQPVMQEATLKVAPGKHQIVVRAEGYKTATETIEVKAGTRLPIELELELIGGDSKVQKDDAEPAGAGGEKAAAAEPHAGAGADVAQPKPDSEPKAAKDEPKAAADEPKTAKDEAKAKPDEPSHEAAKSVVKPNLKVESEPAGATVEIDGRRVGKTPVTIKKIDTAKVKSVRLVAKGYRSSTQPVAWDGASDTVALFAVLEKEPEAASPPTPRQAQTERPAPAPKKAKAPKGFGKLVTISNPVAKVSIDGKDSGRWTPIPPAQPLEIGAGDHVITYTAADGRKATRTVTVGVDETAKLVGINDFK